MTKLIAHRGNIYGPNKTDENKIEYIINAINNKYDCEIDIWKIDNNLFLGHDEPTYLTDIQFLLKYSDKLWIHCKNIQALSYLSKFTELNVFWHENDQYTLTSKQFIWSYPTSKIMENCIIVMPELNSFNISECVGICSDFVGKSDLFN